MCRINQPSSKKFFVFYISSVRIERERGLRGDPVRNESKDFASEGIICSFKGD